RGDAGTGGARVALHRAPGGDCRERLRRSAGARGAGSKLLSDLDLTAGTLEMPLIDSHAHLDFEDYGDDLAETLRRAREAGLVHIVVVGQWREPGELRPAS